jgi:tryptophanyl-tRNA synthetase
MTHYEKGYPIYLYTGRGPSTDSMHLGHLLPFIFTKWLQDVFKCPLVIQISDDEKYFYQRNDKKIKNLEYYRKIGIENCKDILALDFDPELTFIFRNTDYVGHMYKNIVEFQRHITYNQIKGIFGADSINGSENSGKISYPAIQAVPTLCTSFPHIFGDKKNAFSLIPCGIDQDPYFRMTRDVAHKLKFIKPGGLYSKFFPALKGFQSKMSSSDDTSAIFLTDTPKQIKKKINKYAFSGGRATAEEQREHGADLSVDVSYNYLRFFMEDDDKLADIAKKYSTGEMLTGEIKKITIEVLQKIVKNHQVKRSKITDEMVHQFMKIRPILKK